MKKSLPYLILLIGVMVLIGYISQRHAGRRINWEPNYRMDSRVPFGCYLTDKYIESTMSIKPEYVDQTIYTILRDTTFTEHNYVIINEKFQPSALDVIELCRFVNDGNTVFISAGDFGLLGDSLKVYVSDPMMMHMQEDSTKTLNTAISYNSDSVRMNLVNPALKLNEAAVYDKSWISYVFHKLNSADVTILGIEASGYTNFINYKFGEGQFIFHCMPEAFCNYYAGKRNNAKYLFGALSYLPDQPTFIDRNYKIGKIANNEDSRRYILSQPALRLAYYIIIVAGIVALLFAGKRKQRPVAILPAVRNTTLDFVEQVGALYYKQSDHSNIVNKKINYFLESVRSRFFVTTIQIDDRLVERVTALSGVPLQQVQHLFHTIKTLRYVNNHTSKELKTLVTLIREFNQRSKR